MPRNRPTRLELHRLRYRKEGHKIPLLDMSALDPIEKVLVSNDFFSRLFLERRISHPYEVYGEVLSSWGLMCPHPQPVRKDSVCGCCGAQVIRDRHEPAAKRAMRA
jgi:hypothetical protein